ncbi:MAG: hypothetical protein V2J24_04390 [Pseudomonadales bacterium]|jgi:hypothetical protein|nr:hypothetical protein [Pseudomonadales bacterium]
MKRYRMDVNPERLVTRHFTLETPEPEALAAALAAVDGLHGVQDVTWNPEDRSLNVLYDNGVEDLGEVMEAIETHGLTVHEDWHSRLSETLWRFEDALVRAAAGEGERHTPGS